MNLVGKIFVVLVLVMSLVFMSFSVAVYATHKNWKHVVTNRDPAKGEVGLDKQLEDLRAVLQKTEDERDELNQKINDIRDRKDNDVAKLETDNAMLAAENQELRTANDNLLTELKEKLSEVDTKVAQFNKLQQEREMLQAQVKKLTEDKDKWYGDTVALTEQLNGSRGEWKLLSEQNAKLAEQISQMDLVMQDEEINWKARIAGLAPPKVNGIVMDTLKDKSNNEWVMISLGADDGISVGHSLAVHRDGQYVATIKVDKTTPDRARARVEVKQYPVQREDIVSTSLK